MAAAVVLAGGGPEPRLAPGLPNKAFLPIGGMPLVVRVTQAVINCGAIDRVVAVGPAEELSGILDPSVEIVPERETLVGNIEAAAAHLGGRGKVLALASDLPLITPEAVGDFLARCSGDADFYYSVATQAAIERRFPTARKTYVRLADGMFCGGSAMVVSLEVLERVRPLIEQMISARKKPWQLAQMFGMTTIMKLASGRLAIAEVEKRAQEIAGVRARAVILDGPELVLDVDADRPENLEAVRGALEQTDGG